jgi:hypothetical protein
VKTLINEHDIPNHEVHPLSHAFESPDLPEMQIIIRRAPGSNPESTRTMVLQTPSRSIDPEDDLANATWEDAEWQ